MSDVDRFIRDGRPRWAMLEGIAQRDGRLTPADCRDLSRLYRSLCADLAQARGLDLPPDVQIWLDDLAGRAHNRLYSGRAGGLSSVARQLQRAVAFVLEDVPREVRANAGWFWLASLLFYGPFLLCGGLAFTSEDLAIAVLPPDMLESMEAMYTDAPSRTVSENATMAGFYVYNNVGIAFRCFATGLLGGLGSLFFLVYNGAVIGTVFGHLFHTGHGGNLLEFTSGHSAWELTGIVLSGAAGLRMGWAVLETDGRTRLGSLRAAGPVLYRLVMGAAFMLGVAASIEGFWSASDAPRELKFAFGVVQVVVVTAWLLRSGRTPSGGAR